MFFFLIESFKLVSLDKKTNKQKLSKMERETLPGQSTEGFKRTPSKNRLYLGGLGIICRPGTAMCAKRVTPLSRRGHAGSEVAGTGPAASGGGL